MKIDDITYHVSRAINTLFLYNVLGTSYGILLGILIISFQELITSVFPPFGMIKWYGFIVAGILLFNIKPIVSREFLDPDIERKLVYTRQILKEGNFTKAEQRAIWRDVIASVMTEYKQSINNNDNLHSPTSA